MSTSSVSEELDNNNNNLDFRLRQLEGETPTFFLGREKTPLLEALAKAMWGPFTAQLQSSVPCPATGPGYIERGCRPSCKLGKGPATPASPCWQPQAACRVASPIHDGVRSGRVEIWALGHVRSAPHFSA